MGFLLTLALFAVFFVLSQILTPKPELENARPANLGDFQFPTATEDRVVPLVWGTVRLKGPNVIWYGNLRQRAIKKKVKTGLFSSSSQTVGFRYFIGIQFGLCRGPVDELLRVWIGEDVVFIGSQPTSGGEVVIDEPKLFGGNDLGQGGVRGTLRFYSGGQTIADQPLSEYLSRFQKEPATPGDETPGDITTTPRYVGTSHCVWEQGYIGNSTNIKPWAFEVRRIPNGLGLSLGNAEINSGNDANPMNVAYELFTNVEWGFGLPEDDLNLSNLVAAAVTLAGEGNGMSMMLDRQRESADLLKEIERQIDGVFYTNRSTGKWEVNLARDGDTPVGTADETNIIQVSDFTRGAFQDTQNVVQVNFALRDKDYFSTFTTAQDMANIRLQGGQLKTVRENYPGVKDGDLANSIAWRTLRTVAFPLAKATLIVNREFWDVNPGDTILFTNADLGITALKMRVTQVDLGELASGRIKLVVVEDVFRFATGSFASPAGGGWVPQADDLVAFPSNEALVINAPRGFITRDPVSPNTPRRVWAGARQGGDNVAQFFINLDTVDDVLVDNLLYIGQLSAELAPAWPTTSQVILTNSTPDTTLDMLEEFVTSNAAEIGTTLVNIMYVDGEFIACVSAQDSGGNLRMNTVYRGLLGTVPKRHAAGTRVFLVFVGGGLSSFEITNGTVDVRLRKESATDDQAVGDALFLNDFAIVDLFNEPYPPARQNVNNTAFPTTLDLSTTVPEISFDDNTGVFGEWLVRRDYRTTDEVASLLSESALPSDFPAANSTEWRHVITTDPTGSPDDIAFGAWTSGSSWFFTRAFLYYENDGLLTGTTIRSRIETRHVVDATTIEASIDLFHDFEVTDSQLDGRTYLGRFDNSTVRDFTAPETGSYDFEITQNIVEVQARINGGSWTTIISLGSTSGTLAGVTVGDDIDVRHVTSGADDDYLTLRIDPPTAAGYWGAIRE